MTATFAVKVGALRIPSINVVFPAPKKPLISTTLHFYASILIKSEKRVDNTKQYLIDTAIAWNLL